MKLPLSFYRQSDPVALAKKLLGKRLFTRIGPHVTGGIIIETECYCGVTDKASHAYGGRRTPRNEMMYGEGGVAYVYFCYGMHHLLNIVTNRKDIPHAILVRALHPEVGIDVMTKRRKKQPLAAGPATLCQALGITKEQNGISLLSDVIWLEEGVAIDQKEIQASPRIGIDYAEEDRLKPWRLHLRYLG